MFFCDSKLCEGTGRHRSKSVMPTIAGDPWVIQFGRITQGSLSSAFAAVTNAQVAREHLPRQNVISCV